MRIYFFIIVYIIFCFKNFIFANSLEELDDLSDYKEIDKIQNSNIPEKPNIFDKINNRESVRNMKYFFIFRKWRRYKCSG